MKKKEFIEGVLPAALLCLGLLTGCTGGVEPSNVPVPIPETVEPSNPPEPTLETEPAATPAPREKPLAILDRGMLKAELASAMEELRQPRVMDISAAGLEQPELDGKNVYYEIIAESPGMKYAYDLTVEVRGTELVCRLSYMPYKTGDFPADFSGEEIASIGELLAAAEKHLGETEAAIRIADPAQEPDKMNRALQQVGGGYILCSLNADGAALQYSPPAEMTLEECMTALEAAGALAGQVVEQTVTPEMSQREAAEALYAYLTVNVTYDQRYYSDRAAMPYASQTAVGALRDHTAICGGYANALKLLYEKAGIPCYTVTGKYFQENHMWNIARLDGQWLWFDATTDRGSTGEFGFLRFALSELDGVKYQYREEDVLALTEP